MNAIQIQSVIVTAAALTQGVKGVKTATAWGNALKTGLSEYPIVAKQIDSWLACGASDKTTSGIAYKACHNKGTFPVEQLFCNSRPKAKRPISQIGMAVAKCLIEGVAYNPDRFSLTVSEQGLEQGLKQFNRTVESEVKRNIYAELPEKTLSAKDRKIIAKASEQAIEATNRQAFNDSQMTIADILAKYSKPVKPQVVKAETIKPEVKESKGKASAKAV